MAAGGSDGGGSVAGGSDAGGSDAGGSHAGGGGSTPEPPALIEVSDDAYAALSSAAAYALNASGDWRRPFEILGLASMIRASTRVANLPPAFDREHLLDLVVTAADEILATQYGNACYSGHHGNGASYSDGCAHFAGNNTDRGSDYTIAVLEAAHLLLQTHDPARQDKALEYWQKGLWVTAHFNDDHEVTTPCLGWEHDPSSNQVGSGRVKWNTSNRWIIANYLVYRIRADFLPIVGGDGTGYFQNVIDASACFRDDLREASKYRCNGGNRCWDEPNGPWWTGWHSVNTSTTYANIEDDASHGSATAMAVYYLHAAGAFDDSDVDAFVRHFAHRRYHSDGTQFNVPQYPDSDTYPGSSCAQGSGTLCTQTSEQAGANNSYATRGWAMLMSVSDDDTTRAKVLSMTPNWMTFGPGSYRDLFVAGWTVFGEVGAPITSSL